jgi:predicted alpha/beta hydrolase
VQADHATATALDVDIHTLDTPGGGRILWRVHAPAQPTAGLVVIGGAMGVPQSHYARFARWLAARGWRVVTFDYRSHGASLPLGPSLRASRATLNDWAADYEALTAHARAQWPEGALHLIGHSLGAQLPGLFERPERIDGLVAIASGSGYWRHYPPRQRRRAPLFWWGIVPVATRMAGYFPGRRLGMVGDLPPGVMRQWRRWCLHPEYSVGVEGAVVRARYARVAFPIRAFWLTDDEMLSEASLRDLLRLYAGAPHTVQRIDPQAHGLRRVGHLGWFREAAQATLWPLTAQALQPPAPLDART